MKTILTVSLVAVSGLLSAGCATKKYVRAQTAPIQTKVDQVAGQAERNTSAIEDTNKGLKELDERTADGLNLAKERAMTAEGRANEAYRRADEAAALARTLSDQNRAELAALRDSVSRLDDYGLHREATIQFGFDKYTLTPESRQALDELAQDMLGLQRYIVAVKGYTDQIGAAEYNAVLSQRRANAVVRYLVAKHNVPLHRIHNLGLGQENPLDESRNRGAHARNRRVEVKIYSAPGVEAPTRISVNR